MRKHQAPQLRVGERLTGQEPMIGTRIEKELSAGRRIAGALKIGSQTVNGLLAGTFGGDTNPQRIINNLSYSLEHDERPAVRRSAAVALGRIGGKRASKALAQCLHTEAPSSLLLIVIQSLGQANHPLAVPSLLDVLSDPQQLELHAAVCLVLGRIGAKHAEAVPDVLPVLLNCLQTGTDEVRKTAFKALAAIRDTASLDNLLTALTSGDAMTRQAAASMLGWQRRIEAIPDLLYALRDDDGDVRRAAADALIIIGDSRAVPGLLAACRDPDREVRSAAAYTLERIGTH